MTTDEMLELKLSTETVAVVDLEKRVKALKHALLKGIALIHGSENGDRKALIAQRQRDLTELELCQAELTEAIRCRDAADLAGFEMAVIKAESEVARTLDLSRTSKKAMDAAFNVNLRFMNGGGRQEASEESDRKRVEIEGDLAKKKAQSVIDSDYLTKARAKLAKAKADLEARKIELDVAQASLK